jgi:oxygen-independent coproporphyrinogen-3 oxidase
VKYWSREPVYGFGMGSHSFDGIARYANCADLETYLQIAEEGRSPVEWRRRVSEEEALEETFFLGLRLTRGLDWNDLQTRFPRELMSECESSLRELANLSLVEWEGSWVRLTPAGMLLSNEVFQRFVRLGRVSDPARI